jgi:hypothetical protein
MNETFKNHAASTVAGTVMGSVGGGATVAAVYVFNKVAEGNSIGQGMVGAVMSGAIAGGMLAVSKRLLLKPVFNVLCAINPKDLNRGTVILATALSAAGVLWAAHNLSDKDNDKALLKNNIVEPVSAPAFKP